MDSSRPRIAYLFSRFPVVSQTFCDSEMLALEARGFDLDIASINPPPNAFRHERFDQFTAEAFYPPPSDVLARLKAQREKDGSWGAQFGDMIARHDRDYGASFKAATRARNALYFAGLFQKRGIRHIHVHFANRATHTALFIKQWAGIPFSFTAHAQDFMVDLGSDALLRELCREAEFVVGVSDFSCGLLRKTCPDSADKIFRVYNGIAMEQFPAAPIGEFGALRIISIGRLIEFKGFHHLADACALLAGRGIDFHWTLVGEGPWREQLETQVAALGIASQVTFAGVQSQESIKRLLIGSDVFCLPCIVDSKGASDILPTVITEAMACSLPVVSTRLVGVPEMVVPEETGLIVEPGDVSALAGALARLANHRDLARRFGKAGRARAERVFELRETSRQLADRFDASLSGSSRGEPPRAACLYLIDAWPPAPDDGTFLADEIAALISIKQGPVADATLLSAKSNRHGAAEAVPDWPDRIEFFPDALVLEAEWTAHPGAVANLINWRYELGSGIDTESYLFQARRALHLARLVEKRGIRHVHASRSGVAITAWLVHRLTGVGFSFAVEPGADFTGAVTDRLSAEASLHSRPDVPEVDLLRLRPVDLSRRIAIGPLKGKLPGQKTPPDRAAVYRDWFAALSSAIVDYLRE
jgi:glycosyltransferase involved in cell wall biosynthesis